jgi:hypothetical protein
MLVSSSATDAFAVTPSDSTDISCEGIYVGTTGNLAIKHKTGSSVVTYVGVASGSILPLRLTNGRIMAATTASNIVALRA